MRKIYLLCLSSLAAIAGFWYYFDFIQITSPFLKFYGLVCLITAVLLISSFFSDLPRKLIKYLVGGSLISLMLVQSTLIIEIIYQNEWSLELIIPGSIILIEVIGVIYLGIKLLVDYIILRKRHLKVK